jgi:PAS domain S-box-containing protein
VRADPDFIGAIKGVHSELCIPLFDQGRVVGILNVESTEGEKLGDSDLRLMTILGEHVSIAIACARLYADVRQSEERYRTLVENLGEGIAIVDPSETFRFANPAAESVFGVSPGSLTGQNLRQFVSEEEFGYVRAETAKRRLGEISTYEQQIMRPDGTVRWIELTASPQYDEGGAFSHTLGIFRDITESKASERNLRESEERFRQLGEAALEGIAITEKGIVIDGNTRLATMLGYTLEEMIGKPVSDFIAPDSQDLVARHIAESYTRPYEHFLRRKDGSTIAVESHARMITWDGRPTRVTGLLDISERRHAQEQLLKLSLAVSQSPASSSLPISTALLNTSLALKSLKVIFGAPWQSRLIALPSVQPK